VAARRPRPAPVAEVESLLELPKGEADLQAIRRWENEAVAANIRAWLASPDVTREHHPGYPFGCECGRFGCDELVVLTIEAFEAEPRVLAPRHRDATPRPPRPR
jgi:hypothetical protein